MDKLFYQNYNGSIQPEEHEKEIDEALTLHPFKDHRYLYKTRQYLHQTKLTQLKEHKQMLEDRIAEMNKDIGSDNSNGSRNREGIFQWHIAKERKRKYFDSTGKYNVLRHGDNAIGRARDLFRYG